jgi:hypothetical protein
MTQSSMKFWPMDENYDKPMISDRPLAIDPAIMTKYISNRFSIGENIDGVVFPCPMKIDRLKGIALKE